MVNTSIKAAICILGIAAGLSACCGGGSSKSGTSSTGDPAHGESGEKRGGPTAAASEASAKIGDKVSFDDSEWIVLSAKDLGNRAKASNQFHEDKKTDGKFVLVSFKVTNKKDKEERVLGGLKIVDSRSREFGHLDDEAYYIPNGKKTLGLEAMPSSMSREFWSVFEVPADATGLKLQVRGLSLLGDKKLVDLGITPAAATASAEAKKLGVSPGVSGITKAGEATGRLTNKLGRVA